MSARRAVRLCGVAAVLSLTVVLGQGTASAGGPLPIDPSQLPGKGAPTAPDTEKGTNCLFTVPLAASKTVPEPQRYLDFRPAWQFSRGQGVKVAVIDTGVAPNPRLPGLEPGGDYVGSSDGTEDCDIHGTIVAGLIAAKDDPNDGFSGVAPDATILTLRQSSAIYQVKGRGAQKKEGENADGYGDVGTLAAAVVRAADLGAKVINISEVACAAPTLDDRALGAAVRYAAVEHDAVIVAAAGNNDRESCKGANPGIDPLQPTADPYDRITTAVSPAWYDDFVLAVGSVSNSGTASSFTVPGPWVDVAAPGENITSLNPVNWQQGVDTTTKTNEKGEKGTFQGTSFSAPLVAGTVALVRARFPQLSATEVMKRIKATAHAPAEGWNPYVGFGVIDPVAAVTATVSPEQLSRILTPKSAKLPIPAAPPAADDRPRNVALIGAGIIATLLVLGVLASFPIRRRIQLAESSGNAAVESSGARPS